MVLSIPIIPQSTCDGQCRRDPANDWFYNTLGETYHKRGNAAQTVQSYEKAIELNPDEWNHYHAYAWGLRITERYEESIHNYARALAMKPTETWLLHWLWQDF